MVQKKGNIKLILRGAGLEVNQTISRDVASDVLRVVLGQPASSVPGASPRDVEDRKPAPRGTLAEFFREVEPKRNPDRIAAIATFEKSKGHGSVTRASLEDGFRSAGEPEPKNFSRDLHWAVRAGWLGGDDENGYYITTSGEKAIREKFSREVLEQTKQKRARARKHRRVKPTR